MVTILPSPAAKEMGGGKSVLGLFCDLVIKMLLPHLAIVVTKASEPTARSCRSSLLIRLEIVIIK